MKFNAELKLHHTNWMINMVSTMTLRYISRVITPKNTLCQKLRFIASYYFPLKIYLHIYFVNDLRFDLRYDLERFEIWRKWGFEIWLNDLNPFLEQFETWVKDLIWDLLITRAFINYIYLLTYSLANMTMNTDWHCVLVISRLDSSSQTRCSRSTISASFCCNDCRQDCTVSSSDNSCSLTDTQQTWVRHTK